MDDGAEVNIESNSTLREDLQAQVRFLSRIGPGAASAQRGALCVIKPACCTTSCSCISRSERLDRLDRWSVKSHGLHPPRQSCSSFLLSQLKFCRGLVSCALGLMPSWSPVMLALSASRPASSSDCLRTMQCPALWWLNCTSALGLTLPEFGAI